MRVVSAQALQVAINSAKTGSGAQAVGSFVPARRAVIQLDNTVSIKDVRGTRVWGDALGGTTFEWVCTDPTKPMFLIDGCDSAELAYFTVKLSEPCAMVFKITDQGAGVSPIRSTRVNIHDVDVEDANGDLETVIYIALTGDGGKNDQHYFARVTAKDYSHSFCRIEGQASVGNRFDECRAQGRDNGQYGLYCRHDSQVGKGGQFLWTGGVLMEHQQADIRGDWRNGKNIVLGPTCEQSARALIVDSAGSSFSGNTFEWIGGEWVNNATIHPADDEIMQVLAGCLHVQGVTFGQAANVNDYMFSYNPPSTKRLGFNFIGNTVWTPLTSGHFPDIAPDSKVGSWRRSGSDPTAAL